MQRHQPCIEKVGSKIDSLYLHIPFCFHKCHYCDFYSIVPSQANAQEKYDQFTERLISELAWLMNTTDAKPRMIFVGGLRVGELAVIGVSMGGFFTDHYGKRMTLFLFNLLAFYCWIISANVTTKWILYVSYSLQGFFGSIAYNCVGEMNHIVIH